MSRVREALAARREALAARADALVAEAQLGPRRGTRKRSAFVAAAGLVALASMFSLVSTSVLAVNFTTASSSYKVYTDEVLGQHAAAYLNVQDLYGDTDDAVAQFGFKSAELQGLCAITHQNMPVIGDVSLMIIAGEPVDGSIARTSPIKADQLYLASDNLTGHGDQIAKMTLGQSADTLMMDTLPFAGTPGAFGLQAETMRVSQLGADTYGIDLQGQINLPSLKIRVLPGLLGKADCTA